MIRKAKFSDLKEILEIERMSFPNPWPEGIFYSFTGHPGFVVYQTEKNITGYLIIFVVNSYAHLANIAVHPHHRRQGIGSVLIRWSIEYAARRGLKAIFLEVRENSTQVQEFYRRYGFSVRGRIRNYYPDDNALVMERKVNNK
ncbi:ribosomal-protein-alanine acetyltransferase [Methanosalsum zhilinae DSM 4017]|uniref:Ribosomal-protein-alanine acetyltransferase n=1 Tax=Methanosalsum zhilinae (strain DSM 4017 / NBRC 107636 / OCM 62 / WeN5) TaxID=679901 RepID=F7XN87_METZD|nr:ribosomal protein S18-alanine N-acetyltransferase [Methanosalsum zhilinae]AEH60044.1 ribosomal-protein-alanine acetyltransferase [Methanosalsum zhilinae DSM 4017]